MKKSLLVIFFKIDVIKNSYICNSYEKSISKNNINFNGRSRLIFYDVVYCWFALLWWYFSWNCSFNLMSTWRLPSTPRRACEARCTWQSWHWERVGEDALPSQYDLILVRWALDSHCQTNILKTRGLLSQIQQYFWQIQQYFFFGKYRVFS